MNERDPDDFANWKIDDALLSEDLSDAEKARITKALDLLVDGEQKLLAIYDQRQSSADSRTTALATSAIGLPTVVLALAKGFTANKPPALPKVMYVVTVVLAVAIVALRSWNAWRVRRRDSAKPGPLISAEDADVADARKEWRQYQHESRVLEVDDIRVRQLALAMWRARAVDSHKVARTKDRLSVCAAIVFFVALSITAFLVANANFKP